MEADPRPHTMCRRSGKDPRMRNTCLPARADGRSDHDIASRGITGRPIRRRRVVVVVVVVVAGEPIVGFS